MYCLLTSFTRSRGFVLNFDRIFLSASTASQARVHPQSRHSPKIEGHKFAKPLFHQLPVDLRNEILSYARIQSSIRIAPQNYSITVPANPLLLMNRLTSDALGPLPRSNLNNIIMTTNRPPLLGDLNGSGDVGELETVTIHLKLFDALYYDAEEAETTSYFQESNAPGYIQLVHRELIHM